jgi:Zn-dependent protease
MLALAHAPVFGWAKPVPVDVSGLPRPRQAMMLVGAAGPAMNFALALLASVALGRRRGFFPRRA